MKTALRFLYAMVLAAGIFSGMHLTVSAQTNRSVGTAGVVVAPAIPLPEQIDFVGLTLADVFNREIGEVQTIKFWMSRVGDVFVPPQLSVTTNITPAQRNPETVRNIVRDLVSGYQRRIRGFVGDTSHYELRWFALRTYPDGKTFITLTQIKEFYLDLSGETPRIPEAALNDLYKVDETAVKYIISRVPGVRRMSIYKSKEDYPGFERDLRYDSLYVPRLIEVKDGGYVCIPTTADLMARLGDKDSKEYVTLWGEPTQPKRYSIATGKSVQIIPPTPKIFPYTDESGTERILLWIRAEPESIVRIRTSPSLIRWEDEFEATMNPGGDYELDELNRGGSLFYSIEFAP